MHNLSKIITTLFGIGYFPLIPGTIASLISVIFYYLFINYIDNIILIILFLIIFVISLKCINLYTKNIKKSDPSEIVIDEFLGITIIVIFYNLFKFTNDFFMFLIILILFRFFDIIKIFPANIIDKKMKNALGVILDDIIAGIYCIITLFIINAFI